jgi:hypothetical protein
VQNTDTEGAFAAWLGSLNRLTGTPEAARVWRERRYRFAHRLGEALVGTTSGQAAIVGPAVYGVWLSWGLLYIGQTTDAGRRLRDLAIGESHHLANTFPPETWDRVVVVAWTRLPEAAEVVERLGVQSIGLALEHRLQSWAQPLANAARRTTEGGWRQVDWTRSTSTGARVAADVDTLFLRVRSLWTAAETGAPASPPLDEAVRCVAPARLLGDDHKSA